LHCPPNSKSDYCKSITSTPASKTEAEMEQLILAFAEARNNYNINQLLLTPCFILDFLCIHPFADGNDRVSRLLSLLLLYKNGFGAGKYISFEGR
jgi:Fic family protein